MIYAFIRYGLALHHSVEDLHKVSLRDFITSKIKTNNDTADTGHMDISMDKMGFKGVLNEMTRRVDPQKHIRFNSRVTRINYAEAAIVDKKKPIRVEIDDESQSQMRADYVIVTCSLGRNEEVLYFDVRLARYTMHLCTGQ